MKLPTINDNVKNIIQFEHFTITEFNNKYGLQATEKMSLDEFTDYIEEHEIYYFYASGDPQDIEREYPEFLHDTGIKCDFIEVNGYYMGIYL